MRKLRLDELQRLTIEEFKTKKKIPIVVVLDSIRSALNVGSFFRTADAFAIEKIYLCGVTAKPPHAEITKTAIGATETVDWEYKQDILSLTQDLLQRNFLIIGVEQTDKSMPLHTMKSTDQRPIALIFGNEVEGLSESILPLINIAVEIPQFGTKHSINVAVCGGIVLYHFAQLKRCI